MNESKMLKRMELKLHLRQLPLQPHHQSVDHHQGPGGGGLVRQLSTSSLPSKQARGSGSRISRNRLTYSFQRIRRRSRVPEEGELNNNVARLPDDYDQLKRLHADFEQFLNVVVADLKEKMDKLRRFKALERTGQERSYSNLQLYMLDKYSSRIQNFRVVSSLNIENICLIHNQTPNMDISSLVEKYEKVVTKMKRRMKDMIDVTDKYAVVEIFDNINILNEASKDLDKLRHPEEDRARRSVVSLMSVPEGDVEDGVRKADVQALSSPETPYKSSSSGHDTNVRTLRSLSDHLCVLRKTYLR